MLWPSFRSQQRVSEIPLGCPCRSPGQNPLIGRSHVWFPANVSEDLAVDAWRTLFCAVHRAALGRFVLVSPAQFFDPIQSSPMLS